MKANLASNKPMVWTKSIALKLNFIALFACLSFGLNAATFPVTNTNDSGLGSLRAAIDSTNANPDADIINITATGTLTNLTTLTITNTVTINGNANFTIQMANGTVFISNGPDNLVFNTLRILDNVTPYSNLLGIWVSNCSSLTITNCVLTDVSRGILVNTSNNVLVHSNLFIRCGILGNQYCADFLNITESAGRSLDFYANTINEGGNGYNFNNIENVSFSLTGTTGIVLPSNDGRKSCNGTNLSIFNCDNIVLDGFDLSYDNGTATATIFGTGLNTSNCDNLTVQNCQILNRQNGITINASNTLLIHNNNIERTANVGNTNNGISVTNGNNATITSNTLTQQGFNGNTFGINLSGIGFDTNMDRLDMRGNMFSVCGNGVRLASMPGLIIDETLVAGVTEVHLPDTDGRTTCFAINLQLDACRDVVIEDFDFSHVGTAIAGTGFNANSCDNLLVRNNTMNDRIEGMNFSSCDTLTVHMNTFTRSSTGNTNEAIDIDFGSNVTVTNNSFTNYGITGNRYTLDINAVLADTNGDRLNVTGNTFTTCINGVQLQNMDDLKVHSTAMSDTEVLLPNNDGRMSCTGTNLSINACDNFVLDNFDLSYSGAATYQGTGLYIVGCANALVSDVTVDNRHRGIDARNNNGISILDNSISDNNGRAINAEGGSNYTIKNNLLTITGLINDQNPAIALINITDDGTNRLDVTGNTFNGGNYAFYIQGMPDLIISKTYTSGTTELHFPDTDGRSLFAQGDLYFNSCNNLVLDDLNFVKAGAAAPQWGVRVTGSTGVTVNNINVSNYNTALRFNGITDLTVTNNTLSNGINAIYQDGFNNGFTLQDNVFDSFTGNTTNQRTLRLDNVGVTANAVNNKFRNCLGGFQIHNSDDLIISDGSVANTNFAIALADSMWATIHPIDFQSSDNILIDKVAIKAYPGNPNPFGTGINFFNSNNSTITNSSITGKSTGIALNRGNVHSITNCLLQENTNGLVTLGLNNTNILNVTASNNNLICNTSNAIFANNNSIVNAANNFWGASDGSSTDTGSGDTYTAATNAGQEGAVNNTTTFLASEDATNPIGGQRIFNELTAQLTNGQTATSAADSTDYGTVNLGSTLSRQFRIANNGLDTMFITSITSSHAQFTLANVPAFVLCMDTLAFDVIYTPIAETTSTSTIAITQTNCYNTEFEFNVSGLGFQPCDIVINSVVVGDESCADANDGTLTVSATCVSCTTSPDDIRYSIDGTNFLDNGGVFTGLADGTYTVTVRDVNDEPCTATSTGHIIAAGTVACCDIAITSVTPTDEGCPGANDGTLTVVATCTTCTTIEYSTDSTNWQTTATFDSLSDGTYTVYVRDSGDPSCNASNGANVINAGVDTTPPTAMCISMDTVYLDINGMATLDPSDINDGSTDNCGGTLTYTLSQTAFDCDDVNIQNGCGDFALDFDGVNEYVESTNPVQHGVNLTYEAWVFVQGTTTNNFQGIITTFTGNQNFSIAQLAVNSSGQLVGELKGDNNLGEDHRIIRTTEEVIEGGWHHLAMTFDGTDLKLFVDGTQNTTLPACGPCDSYDENPIGAYSVDRKILLGAERRKAPGFFSDLIIDEARVWSRTLSEAEVASNMVSCLSGNEQDLELYYQIEENGQNTITDLVNGNHGILVNMEVGTDWVGGAPQLVGGGIENIFTVTDAAGNASTCVVNVTVIDTINPTIVCQSATVNINASGLATISEVDVVASTTDGCAPLTIAISETSWTCDEVGDHTVTITATDQNGNFTECTAVVTVTDTNNECCDIAITSVTPTGEVCPGANDGELAVVATCTTCTTIEYSIDSTNWQTTATFDSLSDGTYTVYVRDSGDPTCNASNGANVINAGTDTEAPYFGTEMFLYSNDFESPSGLIDPNTDAPHCFLDAYLTNDAINTFYGPGWQQTFTVEPLLIDGPHMSFTDPTNIGESYAVGMLKSQQEDRLSYSFDIGTNDFLNIEMDISPIDLQNSCTNDNTGPGVFGTDTIEFELTLYDTPGGSFNINNANTYTVLDQKIVQGNGPVSNSQTFNWKHIATGMDGSAATDGNVTIYWDLIRSNYGSFDNLVITASNNAIENLIPDDLTIQCLDELPAPPTILAFDNCDPNPVITYTQDPASPTAGDQVVIRSWYVTDASNNVSAIDTQLITIDDVFAPTITCPADITVNNDTGVCEATGVTLGTATATDNCNGTVTIMDDGAEPYALGTNTVTWTADDGNGNTSTCTQVVTVEDNEAPMAVCQDITVNLDGSGSATITPADIDNGSSDNCGNVTLSLDITSFDCADVDATVSNNYAIETDGVNDYLNMGDLGNALDFTSQATYQIWTRPLNSIGIQSFIESYNPGTARYISLETDGNKMAFYIGNGNTQLSHATTQANVITVNQWTQFTAVYDGTQANNTDRIKIYVDGVEQALNFNGTVPASVGDLPDFLMGSQFGTQQFANTQYDEVRIWDRALSSAEVAANWDNTIIGSEPGLVAYYAFEDGPGSSTVSELVTGVPATLNNMDPNTAWVSSATGLGGNPDPGVEVTLTVTDENSNTSTCSAVVVVLDNISPGITCPGDMTEVATGSNGAIVTYADPTVNDNCTSEVFQTAGLPSGSTFPVGTTVNTYEVIDVNGNTDECSFNVTVLCDLSITGVTSTDEACPGEDDGTITVSASCASCTSIEYSIDNINWQANGLFENVAANTYTVYARNSGDPTCNASEANVVVNVGVDTEAPIITCTADVTVSTDTGVCEATNLSLTASTVTDNCTAGIVPTSDAPTTFSIGTTTVTWTADDGNGNTSTCTQVVTVEDNEAPVITCPNDVTVYTGVGGIQFIPIANYPLTSNLSDVTGNNSDMFLSGNPTPPSAPNATNGLCFNGIHVVLPNGQNASVDITGFDETNFSLEIDFNLAGYPSTASGFPIIFGGSSYRWMAIHMQNNTNAIGIKYNNQFTTYSTFVPNLNEWYSATVTYMNETVILSINGIEILNDNIGALVTAGNHNFLFNDNSAGGAMNGCVKNFKVHSNGPGGNNTCDAVVAYSVPTGVDNCVGSTTSQTLGIANGGLFPLGITLNRYKVEDANGNIDSCSFTVTVLDTINPVITCPANITVSADAGVCEATNVTLVTATATDNCTTITISNDAVEPYALGANTVTWTADDGNGQTATCMQTVSIVDNEVPTITCPANIYVNADVVTCPATYTSSNLTAATGTDNCGAPTITNDAIADLPIGDNIITWTSDDGNGNSVTCMQTVTVVAPYEIPNNGIDDDCDGTVDEEAISTWIPIPAGNTGSCVSNTDCCTDTYCFGLEYTPVNTGVLTSYTTGFTLDCIAGNNPVITNISCVMTDNSIDFSDCAGGNGVLYNSSGNNGAVSVTDGVPVIIHQICFNIPAFESVTVSEDPITDISMSLDMPNGDQLTEYPTFTDVTAYGNTPPTITSGAIAACYADAASAEADALAQTSAVDDCSPTVTLSVATVGSCSTVVRVYATDHCGLVDSVDYPTTIDGAKPVVTGSPNITVIEGCLASLAPVALTTVAALEALPGGATIDDACTDDATLVVTHTETIAGNCPIVITRTYTMTDICGNSEDLVHIIHINDTTAPSINGALTMTTVEGCSAAAAPAAVTTVAALEALSGNLQITDACPDNMLTVTHSDNVNASCITNIIRIYTITDQCGNQSNVVHILKVQDTTSPIMTAGAINACYDTQLDATTAAINATTFTDNCSSTLTYNSEVSGTCPSTILVIGTDNCGNKDSVTYTTVINFGVGPLEQGGPVTASKNIQITLDAVVPTVLPVFVDVCGNTLSPTGPVVGGTYIVGQCSGTITYTYTYTDCAGAMADWVFTYNIDCQKINVKAYLQGDYVASSDSMRTNYNYHHLLPGQNKALSPSNTIKFFGTQTPFGQPYQGAPWNYTGNLGNTFGDQSAPGAPANTTPYPSHVADWVLITVRENGILPANNIWTCAGWMHKNGEVSFPETCPTAFNLNTASQYYVVLEHRNHLPILDTATIKGGGTYIDIDFTTNNSYQPPFRTGQSSLGNGKWGMLMGNMAQNGNNRVSINSADRTAWRIDQNKIGYFKGDVNLDATTNSQDETLWKTTQNKATGIQF